MNISKGTIKREEGRNRYKTKTIYFWILRWAEDGTPKRYNARSWHEAIGIMNALIRYYKEREEINARFKIKTLQRSS